MQPSLFDTSIYIAALRRGNDAAVALRRVAADAPLWLSSVVLEELYAGAGDRSGGWLNDWNDFQPAPAQRSDGEGGAATRAGKPDGPGGASQITRPVAATAGLDRGRAARATGAERPSDGQLPASLAGAAEDGATA